EKSGVLIHKKVFETDPCFRGYGVLPLSIEDVIADDVFTFEGQSIPVVDHAATLLGPDLCQCQSDRTA
ncbi:hypothetical protein, partial [Vibrio vulnificus]|uniref:hypothetical protein n=1 Tax=Vibrio vulnificus TaxID=672 RepID=UPI0019D4833B